MLIDVRKLTIPILGCVEERETETAQIHRFLLILEMQC